MSIDQDTEAATVRVPTGDTLRSTLPPKSDLAKTVLATSSSGASRRTSLIASLSGAPGPLPDRYQEGKVLGKGGMGVVVLAEDHDLARTVAVKKLRADANAPEHVDRFLREAQVTAQLEHPGILPVHDLGVDQGGDFFYVMRLVRGDETLRSVIDRLRAGDDATHRELTFERRVEIIQQVARVLHYAHARGVIHRDVKPENIMLGSFGEVYLVDWGLAKQGTGPDDAPLPTTVPSTGDTATQAGSLVGTPRSMAPEQADRRPATARSDIYALTAVLYELLTLRHPLGDVSGSLEQLLHRILTQPHVPAETLVDPKNGRVPRHLSLICDRGLAKDPEKRYASALELERALQGWLEGEGPVVCPITLQLRLLSRYKRAASRRPMLFAFLTMFLPAAIVLGLVGWRVLAALAH